MPARALQALKFDDVPVRPVAIVAPGQEDGHDSPLVDREGLAALRYDGQPGTCYLIRPDQHVAARFRRFDIAALRAARDRALGREPAMVAEGRAVVQ